MLDIKDAVVHYGEAIALHGVSLNVEEGEFVCLLGPNGAGKTTLLMSICGLVNMTSGKIQFTGKDISNVLPSKIQRMGICQVPEGRQIFPSLTVHENLLVGAYTRKDHALINRDIERFAEMFPVLNERKNQRGESLSGGEQQLVAIFRALMSKPKLLLLDEPSLGLAPLFIKKVYEIIQEIHKDGNAILLVEQNARMALETASRAYILDVGKIVISDTAAKVASNDAIRKTYLGE